MQKKNSNIQSENKVEGIASSIESNSTKKFLASFMICLIVFLPFYVSSAYADTTDLGVGDVIEDDIEGEILSVLATGMDGIEGYTSTLSDDYVSLTITLIYTLDQLEDNQVRVRFNGGAPLNPECTSDGESTYTCVLEHSSYNDNEGKLEYGITLTDQYLAIIDTFSGEMYVDGIKPTVNLLVSKKPKESKISIDVAAKDTACSSGCVNKCSGVQELNLYIKEEGEALDPFHTITTFDGCDYEEDDLEFDYSTLGIDGGITEFCISGKDNVGNEKEKCKSINLDISAPIFLSDLIAKKNGKSLNYIITGETPKVNIYLNVTDDNTLSTSSVTADFTGLNPSQSSYNKKVPSAVKTYEENIEGIEESITIYEFEWKDVILNNPEGFSASVLVSDVDENTAESDFTISVNFDDNPPEVGALYTDKSILYLNDSTKNIIYVDFVEIGSGLNADEVFLDLSEISGEAKKKANNCTAGDSGLYSCVWNNINPSKLIGENPKIDVLTALYYVKKEAKIHPDTTDIAGNKISTEYPESLKQELIFDNIAPEIISIDISSATSQGLEAAGFTGSAEDFASTGLVDDSGTADSAPGFTPASGDETADTEADLGEIDVTGQAFGSSSTKAGQIITNAEEEIIIISAYVMEYGSMLDPSNVVAQLNVEELWPQPMPATSCDLIEPALIEDLDTKYKTFPYREYIYQCIWELPTVPIPGSYYFNLQAVDAAGNVYEKNSDKFKVYELVEGDANFFEDEVELNINDMYDYGYELNQNFLRMSTQTFFRMEIDLSDFRRIAGSFVHDFTLGECTAVRGEGFTADDIKPVAIVSQTYLSDSLVKSREQKEIMLAIPQFEATDAELKAATKKGPKEDPVPLTIACMAQIVQSSIAGKKAYTPNEEIVFSLEIPLGKDLFSNPADSTLDKALEYKKGIDALNSIIDILKYVEYIAPYCKMINLVMQIWNSICMIYEGFGAAFAPANVAAGECKLGLDFLTKLWYGGTKGDPAKVGEIGALENQWSNKDALSLGFVCDLTLCTTCSQLWGSKISGGALDIESWSPDKLAYSIYGGKGISPEDLSKIGGENPMQSQDPAEYWTGGSTLRFPFDPHKNFWVALICWPPCIPTIIRTLEMVKRILVAQNTCYNKAYLLGEDIEDCSSVGWKIFCMLTFGQFMHILPDMMRQYASKLVSSLVSRLFEVGCTGVTKAQRLSCGGVRARNFIVGVLSILDLATNIRQLYEEMEDTFDFGKDSSDDGKAKDEFNKQAQEYGTLPAYD